MMPKRITPSMEEKFRLEAERRRLTKRRAGRFSNKELAALTGMAASYVASIVSKMRREIESKVDISNVPRETSTNRPEAQLR
jgi:hypothetical protein